MGFGRELHLPQAAFVPHRGVAAYLTFDQLCGRHGIEGHVSTAEPPLSPSLIVRILHLSLWRHRLAQCNWVMAQTCPTQLHSDASLSVLCRCSS